FAQREGGVDAAVVELDALADAVRPAAEDDDLLLARLAALIFVAVGGVVVGRVGLELGGAGINETVGGGESELLPHFADQFIGQARKGGDLIVTKSLLLSPNEGRSRPFNIFV